MRAAATVVIVLSTVLVIALSICVLIVTLYLKTPKNPHSSKKPPVEFLHFQAKGAFEMQEMPVGLDKLMKSCIPDFDVQMQNLRQLSESHDLVTLLARDAMTEKILGTNGFALVAVAVPNGMAQIEKVCVDLENSSEDYGSFLRSVWMTVSRHYHLDSIKGISVDVLIEGSREDFSTLFYGAMQAGHSRYLTLCQAGLIKEPKFTTQPLYAAYLRQNVKFSPSRLKKNAHAFINQLSGTAYPPYNVCLNRAIDSDLHSAANHIAYKSQN